MTSNKNILIGAGLIGASLFVLPNLFNSESSSGGSTFGGGGSTYNSGGSTPSVASVGLPSSTGGLDSSTTKKDATISSLPDVNIYESSDIGRQTGRNSSPYTSMTSSSPVGTTYPVYSNGTVTGYEVMTSNGGVSTNQPSAYGGTTTTKKESSTAQPSIISSIGSASGIGSSPIASAVGSFLGRWF